MLGTPESTNNKYYLEPHIAKLKISTKTWIQSQQMIVSVPKPHDLVRMIRNKPQAQGFRAPRAYHKVRPDMRTRENPQVVHTIENHRERRKWRRGVTREAIRYVGMFSQLWKFDLREPEGQQIFSFFWYLFSFLF